MRWFDWRAILFDDGEQRGEQAVPLVGDLGDERVQGLEARAGEHRGHDVTAVTGQRDEARTAILGRLGAR